MSNQEWKKIIKAAAEDRAKQVLGVALKDEATRKLRIEFGKKLEVPKILTTIVDLANDATSEAGRGMRSALNQMSAGTDSSRYYWKEKEDTFALYRSKDEYAGVPIFAIGFGDIQNSERGILFITQPLSGASVKKKIGYTSYAVTTAELVAENLSDLIFHPNAVTLLEAPKPKDYRSIENEGQAVYARFGKIFDPPDDAIR